MPALIDQPVQHALRFFEEWYDYTKEALAIVAPQCPLIPQCKKDGRLIYKTRKWLDPSGPIGLLYHFTGGPDGIASMRWGNENASNCSSSWHCTVLDYAMEELNQLVELYSLVKQYLPVTALLHAPIEYGTWHGNWTNSRTFGLENRNVGRLATKDGKHGRITRRSGSNGTSSLFRPLLDQSRAMLVRGLWWESYTREQIITNINIGKMLKALRGCDFKPSWVLPHSAVWCSKSDTGPAFPMEWVRDAVFSSVDPVGLPWIRKLQSIYDGNTSAAHKGVGAPASDVERRDIIGDAGFDSERQLHMISARDFDKTEGSNWRSQLPVLRDKMRQLGYYIPHAEAPFDPHQLEPELRLATHIFQTSTKGPGFGHSPLIPDGIPGAKTLRAVEWRMHSFNY